MKLMETKELVHMILSESEAARNSDNDLYIKVLEYYGRILGVDFDRVSVTSFFKYMKRNGIPPIETVGRCRRKAQEQCPWLRGNDFVQDARRDLEDQFKDFARKK